MNTETITTWLKDFDIINYTINDDLTVDVNGSVNLSNKGLSYLPLKFFKVLGNFNCSRNSLIDMGNFPEYVKDN